MYRGSIEIVAGLLRGHDYLSKYVSPGWVHCDYDEKYRRLGAALPKREGVQETNGGHSLSCNNSSATTEQLITLFTSFL